MEIEVSTELFMDRKIVGQCRCFQENKGPKETGRTRISF